MLASKTGSATEEEKITHLTGGGGGEFLGHAEGQHVARGCSVQAPHLHPRGHHVTRAPRIQHPSDTGAKFAVGVVRNSHVHTGRSFLKPQKTKLAKLAKMLSKSLLIKRFLSLYPHPHHMPHRAGCWLAGAAGDRTSSYLVTALLTRTWPSAFTHAGKLSAITHAALCIHAYNPSVPTKRRFEKATKQSHVHV